MKAQHTLGPWEMNGPSLRGNGYNIGSVNSHRTTEGSANARLIAAAPELLEVCERLHKLSGENGVPLNLSALAEFQNEVFRLTAKVIAKAK